MRTAFIFLVTMTAPTYEAAAEIRADWNQLYGTEALEVDLLETDGTRLYAAGKGVHISLDDGYTWRSTEPQHGVSAIAISRDAVYASTFFHGVFRSDSHGNTWQRKNRGIRFVDRGRELGPPIIKQILVASSGTVIAVGYHKGTYISDSRGETWRSIYEEWIYSGNKEHNIPDWHFGDGIWAMTEFNGFWWAVYSSATIAILRSPDNGETWEHLPRLKYGQIADWAVLGDRLYVAGDEGFGRWNEAQNVWEHLSQGLPTDNPNSSISTLTADRNRIFAGFPKHGVYMFDERSETWIPAGLDGLTVYDLISHQSYLYAATKEGIYRASIPVVQPYNKAAATWGAIKQK
jgi:hypothetical protein